MGQIGKPFDNGIEGTMKENERKPWDETRVQERGRAYDRSSLSALFVELTMECGQGFQSPLPLI